MSSGIYFLVPTLVTIILSMLIVRAGAVALMMTGMNYDRAKFQALSAFSGTGFTTREAERVVNNPDRRKIITWLMILGNAGIVTVIVTATSSFSHVEGLTAIMGNLLFLALGSVAIGYLAKYTGLTRRWELYIHDRLAKFRENEEDLTPEELFHLSEGFGVLRFQVPVDSPLCETGFSGLSEKLDNASILGLERKGEWVSKHHHAEAHLASGDLVVVYGNISELRRQVKQLIDLSQG